MKLELFYKTFLGRLFITALLFPTPVCSQLITHQGEQVFNCHTFNPITLVIGMIQSLNYVQLEGAPIVVLAFGIYFGVNIIPALPIVLSFSLISKIFKNFFTKKPFLIYLVWTLSTVVFYTIYYLFSSTLPLNVME